MKEATGEGSMTIITIVIIVGLAAAAAIIVSIMMTSAKSQANNFDENNQNFKINSDYNSGTQTTNP